MFYVLKHIEYIFRLEILKAILIIRLHTVQHCIFGVFVLSWAMCDKTNRKNKST